MREPKQCSAAIPLSETEDEEGITGEGTAADGISTGGPLTTAGKRHIVRSPFGTSRENVVGKE